MASSSTLHPSPQPKFDVFISFRGVDTRQNILSHLKVALSRANIAAFIDDHLNRGDKITEALPTAIEESKLSIVLFSENYAKSRWCLDELVKILECMRMNGQMVVPVFYNVNPSVVRNQTGSFAEAFAQHSEKNFHKISMWKDALKEAADLSGWDSHVTSPDATLVDKIVEDVSAKLGLFTSSGNDDSFVGINERIHEIESLLSKSSKDIHTIGIWGMGGIGKSTLARAFFNKVCAQFDAYCFLDNVRGESQIFGLKNLRKELLSAMFYNEMGREIVRQESVDEPGERSRLWDAEDVANVLAKNTGTKSVSAIVLDTSTLERVIRVCAAAFKRMDNLRLLQFTDDYRHKCKVQLPRGLESLPDELRYLRWGDYPLTYLPTGFDPVNLVELKMRDSHLEQLWHGRQDLPNLKHIDLSDSRNFIRIPDLTLITNLETLFLSGTAVEELPSSIEHLTSLVGLNLMNCKSLRNIPIGIGNLKCLKYLFLSGATIEELPPSIESLIELVTLFLEDCKRLRNLPIGIGNLKCLKYLCSSGSAIEELPSSSESLTQLVELNLCDCKRLRSLPIVIGNFKRLNCLLLSGTAMEDFGFDLRVKF